MKDLDHTVLSQYANSPVLMQLVQNMNDYIDPSSNIDAFFDLVWNVATAKGIGLDIWGRIVDVPRQLQITDTSARFGFTSPSMAPFDQAPFNGGGTDTATYNLSDTAYRTLIMAKALANISATTAPAINQLLRNMFAGRGDAYVVDLGGMAMKYVFSFFLQPYEVAIVQQANVLPRPAGVSFSYSASAVDKTFGFAEAGSGAYPFGEGTYAN